MTDPEIQTRRVELEGIGLQVTSAGPDDGPLVLLLHGFPELAYSWRYQIRALAAEGYRVLAPDMRGYGASDRPDEIEAYDILHLVGDVVELIRTNGRGPATVIGHDWGALVAWATANFRPDLLRGVCGVSVPYSPSIEMSLPDLIRSAVGPDGFHYMLYFQEPGVADAELDADPLNTMRRLFWLVSGDMPEFSATGGGERTSFLGDTPVPDGLPPWLDEGDLNAYAQAFMRTGFTGGINWYRNLQRNWDHTRPWRHAPITVPAMFVGGTEDPVLTGSAPAGDDHPFIKMQAAYCPDIRVRWIEGAGHWTQQEKPSETNAALLDFLREVNEA